MITQLPTVASALMSDVIYAVQGYISPTSPGLSVQETLQQVYNLFQANIILFYAGNPNGNVAGTTYQFCWDTTDNILYVCTTSGAASTAVWSKSITLTAGSGISINQAGSAITISSTAEGSTWVEVTTATQSMSPDISYQANYGSLCTLTLPTTSAFGTFINVAGFGTGGWTIAQNSGQNIIVGKLSSTIGIGGSVSSSNQYDSINLYCAVANTTWQVLNGPQSAGLIII
jgi:hypothetical protein